MTKSSNVSRRVVLGAGAGSLAMAWGTPTASAAPGSADRQEVIRTWYAAWEKKDWGTVDALSAGDFAFSSAAGDDHISKSTFKTRCWDTQSPLIDRFELESVLENGTDAFVQYRCQTKNGKVFRNVEHFKFKGDKITELECFFGGAGYPSAAEKAKR